MPRIVAVDPKRPAASAIREAADVLRRGGLVAFPTETVYGLAARGLSAEHVARVFEAKGRPRAHPLILHVSSEEMAKDVARAWSDRASALAGAFWPGPLSLVVPRADRVPKEVTAGLDTVAVRAPSHGVALALIDAVGEPLAAPSANAHTHVSPTAAAHVVASLGDRVDLVLDGGPCTHGIESTVIDVDADPPRILRPGVIALEAVREVLPAIVLETGVAEDDVARASPGLASKHYAPRVAVTIAASGAIARVLARTADAGLVAWSDFARDAAPEGTRVATLSDTAEGYARGLYAALHDLEAQRVACIVIEDVPDEPEWCAIRDRLMRAAAKV